MFECFTRVDIADQYPYLQGHQVHRNMEAMISCPWPLGLEYYWRR